jgi:hypothetical protein
VIDAFDREYHLQNAESGNGAGVKEVFSVPAGKAGEHCLRAVPSIQALRDGVALQGLVTGARRMPLAAPDGGPMYLKRVLLASQERTDLKLGYHYLAGAVDGSGLTPTYELATVKVSNLLSRHGLKMAYLQGSLALPGCYPATPAGDGEGAEEDAEAGDAGVDEAAKEQVARAAEQARLRHVVLNAPLFLSTR